MLLDWFHLDLNTIADPLERRQAPLVQRMLLGILGLTLVSIPIVALQPLSTKGLISTYVAVAMGACLLLVALFVLRRGYVHRAVLIGAFGMVLGMQSTIIAEGLSSGRAPVIVFALPVTLVGLVAGRRMLLLTVGLIMLMLAITAGMATAVPEWVGFAPMTGDHTGRLITSVAIILGMIVLLLDRFGSSLRDALAEAAANQQAAEAVRRHVEEQAHSLAEKTARLEQTEQYLRALVATLEAPAVTLADGVLLTPVVGALDSQRVQALTERLLQQVSVQRTRQIVIDIAGVPIVDTNVAQGLVHMFTAIKLLGCAVTVTGISATVAETMVQLGITFDGIMIARSPQDVLEMQIA